MARVEIVNSPANIRRDRQQRIIEISGTVADATLGEVNSAITQRLHDFELPPGYALYDGGEAQTLQQGEQLARMLIGLALFLVLVVMAVQYESLRNPLIIMVSVPFAVTGVAIALWLFEMPLSMPIWLGMIMLAGIVVNNAIILVEYIEIERGRGRSRREAILEASRTRLRPILMTTITTVVGMLPLAIGYGDGSELLQPLAITVASGLAFGTLVSLVLVPSVYLLLGRADTPLTGPAGSEQVAIAG
jgi:multidrug efflux pump subunit AcrB